MSSRLIASCVGACFYSDLRVNNGPGSEDGRTAFEHWERMMRNPKIGRATKESEQFVHDMNELGVEAFAEQWAFLVAEWRAEPERTWNQLHAAFGAVVAQGLERLEQLDRAKFGAGKVVH